MLPWYVRVYVFDTFSIEQCMLIAHVSLCGCYNVATPCMAIPCMAVPHVALRKLHEMRMFHATRKLGPCKHVMGIFVDFSWHHAWSHK